VIFIGIEKISSFGLVKGHTRPVQQVPEEDRQETPSSEDYSSAGAQKRPSMSRAKTGKGRKKVSVGEAASRVVVPVYHYSE
jgi:hypothetical protein